jgi:hypothetical protein
MTTGTDITRANPSWFLPMIAQASEPNVELNVSTALPG